MTNEVQKRAQACVDRLERRRRKTALGYDQTAYTSTSALWGLFCLRSRPTQRAGCIIKTRQFGLLFVQDLEDLNLCEGGAV
jgi:hypothetical protein